MIKITWIKLDISPYLRNLWNYFIVLSLSILLVRLVYVLALKLIIYSLTLLLIYTA